MVLLEATENNGFKVTEQDYMNMQSWIDILVYLCHESSRAAGWYHDVNTGYPLERNVPEMMMLMVSEIAEAMEGYRKNLMDDKLPNRKMAPVELADLLIRTFDLAGYFMYLQGYNINSLGECFAEKFHYNQTREDHKIENRKLEGGKAF